MRPASATAVGETLSELFAFKHSLGKSLDAVPHVVEDEPAVCAWYPTARKALVWNLSEQHKSLTIAMQDRAQHVRLGPLEATMLNFNLAGKA